MNLGVDAAGRRTLRDLLMEKSALHPDKEAFVFESVDGQVTSLSYAQLLRRVGELASGLVELGVRHGDAVVVHLPNCEEFVLSWFALAFTGGVMVPTNLASTSHELADIVIRSRAVFAITTSTFRGAFRQALDAAPDCRGLIVAQGFAGDSSPGEITFADVLGRSIARLPELASDDVVEMLFTSGTTSRPKGVLLTHANCINAGIREAVGTGLRHEDRSLTALPLFHCNAQSITTLSCLTVGGTVVILEQFSASKYMAQVRRHRATATSLVAVQVRTLLRQPPEPDDAQHELRTNYYAINVTDAEKDAFEHRFGIELLNGYGLSEAMTVVTISPVNGPRRWPSVGLPTSDHVVRIVDEDGIDVPAGDVGELILSGIPGRTIMRGYHDDPDATAKAIRDGWLWTGDQAYFDEFGYVYFYDRSKDVIKRSGENISAGEVERVLLDHPDVIDAAVIGIPDELRDEAVKAFVVLRPGSGVTRDDITDHCSVFLAPFKIPTIIELRDELPKTSVGKVEKKLLRDSTRHPS